MKSFFYGLVALTLLAGLFFSPAVTAPVSAASCGDTYVVQRGDYLSKIARNCGVSLSTIISLNPQIKDINKIYAGQVIRLTSSGTIPDTGTTTGKTYTVVKGDYLSLIAVRFGTTVAELLRLNPGIKNPSIIYAGQVINLPSGSTGTTTSSLVTVSTRYAKVGAQVEVKVTGFPANADIDFRVGEQGENFVKAYDGKTDSSGAASIKITIPSEANVNEKWVVKVQTTSIAKGKEATSPTITIIN